MMGRAMRLRPAGMLFLAVLSLIVAPTDTSAWPDRTVRVIVPNPPGTTLDIVTRLFADRLASRWARAVVVENIPGADGNLAAREFVAKRDDHTLLYSFPGLITINPLTYVNLPYDPSRDLVPIASTSDNYVAIAVSGNLKIKSLAELTQLARLREGRLNWAATPGIPYFALAGLQQSVGISMTQVPYRDFNQALADLSEGRIDAVATGVTPLLPYAGTGKVSLLAFVNRQRAPFAAEIPTMAEAGFADLTFDAVTGFFGWRDMPTDLRERIALDVQTIAADSATRERLLKVGAVARGSTPAEFAAVIEEQRAKIANIARTVGLRPTQ
jgi:tripartite-type tricarboxylate transporter receptor subunit TctC